MPTRRDKQPLSLPTVALHGGEPAYDPDTPVVQPLFQSVNYVQEVGTGEGLRYPRYGNAPNAEIVQRRIAAGEARALKILSLALDAGFASKSTFNQVFKKHTSQTPSDFRQTVGATDR